MKPDHPHPRHRARSATGQPCFVLAEVASAHGGSADAALKMLEAAFKMGADGIKFQLFRSELLVVRRHPGRKDFDQIELTEKEWQKVLRAAKASGLAVLAEAFDLPSLELAAEEGVDAYKVHTTDMENPEFIKAVAALGKPVLFATGGVPEDAVREALDLAGGAPGRPAARLPDLPHPGRGDPLPRARGAGRSATACRSASSTTPTAAARSRWWRPRWPWPRARTWWRSTSRSTAARRASTTSRRSTPRTSTAWSSCCGRPSARRATAPAAESEAAQRYHRMMARSHRGRRAHPARRGADARRCWPSSAPTCASSPASRRARRTA